MHVSAIAIRRGVAGPANSAAVHGTERTTWCVPGTVLANTIEQVIPACAKLDGREGVVRSEVAPLGADMEVPASRGYVNAGRGIRDRPARRWSTAAPTIARIMATVHLVMSAYVTLGLPGKIVALPDARVN